MKNLLRFVLTFSFALLASLAIAVPPQTVNYQGDLTNIGGTPINAPVSMTFRLYNAAQGGLLLYTEVQPSIGVSNGSFNAVIGAVTPITLPFDVPYWLSVQVNADPEMAPRQPLASSPYAFRASTANTVLAVTGSQISGSITTATIPVANVIGAVAGPPGPVGATGPQGATGLTGATGTAGTAGATGAQGLQGVMGAAGAAGAQGPIGLTGPAGPNSITGNLTMVNSTSSSGNIVKGLGTFIHNFGIDNTFLGVLAGNLTMTGTDNVGTGYKALSVNMAGSANTASGREALSSNTSGSGNTAIGYQALVSNASSSGHTAIGLGALRNHTTGDTNIAIGDLAGSNLTSGSSNILIGDAGNAVESNTMRLGNFNQIRTFIGGIRGETPALPDSLPVVIDSAGQLGTGGGGAIVPTGGAAGQVLQGAAAGPVWSSTPTLSGSLNFGSTTLQKLNLFGAAYGIGVQDFTVYQRSSDHFAWYRGGVHSNTVLTPGAGGTTLMTLSSATLTTPVIGLARAQSFSSVSDRAAKEAFAAVDGAKILAALVRMPMQSWKYRNEEKVRHIGPTAQDFRAAFGVGYDDKTIATVDADGVAMAAIQGLNAKVGKLLSGKDAEISALKGEIAELRRAVQAMMARLSPVGKVANAR